MKRIIFVDDEPNILSGLRRMLRGMNGKWEMNFAESAFDALEELKKQDYDVIVSDIRMPRMDGIQLLDQVSRIYPQMIRFALSGQSDNEAVLRSIGPTHQFLAKPCDAEKLKNVIQRSINLREVLSNQILKRLVSQIGGLPSLPEIYLELINEINSPTGSLARVGDIISSDIGMTAQILKIVNSAYFGFTNQIKSPAQAATLLGTDNIRALVLFTNLFSMFTEQEVGKFNLDNLWLSSTQISLAAERFAQIISNDKHLAEESFMAGMLNEVGLLILISRLPNEYETVLDVAKHGGDVLETERIILGCTHSEVGAYLLGLWGLPDSIIEAVCFRDIPSQSCTSHISPLTTVHLAYAFQTALANTNDSKPIFDINYLNNLNLSDKIEMLNEQFQTISNRV